MPSWSSLLRALVAAFVLALGLTGCAAFRSYDAELNTTLGYAFSGNVDGAIKTLESNNRLPDQDLLYYFELGMLQRLGEPLPGKPENLDGRERAASRCATRSPRCAAWWAPARAT